MRLARRTALKASKPLAPMSAKRRAALAAEGVTNPGSTFAAAPKLAAPASAGKPRKPRVSTGPDRATVAVVYERAQHGCERCAEHVGPERGVDHHIHHRRPRAAGGSKRDDTNSPANLVLICPDCHSEVESYREAAYAEGWLVRQTGDPAEVPILIERGNRWVLLSPLGLYLPAAPIVAGAA